MPLVWLSWQSADRFLRSKLSTPKNKGLKPAQHPDYGLAADVHTADFDRALRWVAGIEAGTAWVSRYEGTSAFATPTGA